jgi:iron complex outermembrane recepter protein
MTINPKMGLAGVAIAAISSANGANAQDAAKGVHTHDQQPISEIIVHGSRTEPDGRTVIDPRHIVLTKPDVADLASRVPGANVVSNGPVAGQVQYRGMNGPRLNVRLDNMQLNSGGPNLMDPPLHYMPEPLLDQLSVVRGIAPVSAGTSIGGVVKAKAKSSKFGSGDAVELQADVSVSGRSVNDGYAAGGLVGAGTSKYRFHVLGSSEGGADTQFDGGEMTPTAFERHVYGVGAGIKLGDHELGFDYRHHDTGHAGNPALGADMGQTDTDLFNLTYGGRWQETLLGAQVFYSDVAHDMDNFSQRVPPANPMMYRLPQTKAEGLGFKIDAAWPFAGGELTVGVDGHYGTNNINIVNPRNPMFFVRNVNDAERDSTGAFIEWEGMAANVDMLVGARYTRVDTDAGDVFVGPALPAAVQNLAARFNSVDRSKSDDNFDLVGRFSYRLSDDLDLTLGLGRKTRSPFYIERYAWLPTGASAGLADGNNYVGSPGLDPEVSYEVEAGFDWDDGDRYFTPRLFYRSIDDYIQGAPATDMTVVMVSTNGGDATPLQFTNVDVEMYGFDASWGYVFSPRWHVDGILTYVRGKRRDTHDDLYRITPPRATAGLSYMGDGWFATVEGVGVAQQGRVSVSNGEPRTGGHALLNIRGQLQVNENTSVVAGIDNLLDRQYTDHLAGFNRARGTDVPVGARLPGSGLNAFIRVGFVY